MNEAEILPKLKAGDMNAIGSVIETYLPQIVRAGLGAGLDDHAADDVAQETFAAFMKSITRFEGRSSVRTFLFGIFFRKVQEHNRQNGKMEEVDNIEQVMDDQFVPDGHWESSSLAVDFGLEQEDTKKAIASCLVEVPEQQKMAFLLKEAEGHSAEEVCEIMNVTSNNLGVLLYRARNRLRLCLEHAMAGEV